jgi:Flp pilus assembly protein TadB
MPDVRVAPDRLGPLCLQQLERDRTHRRDGRQLDEALSLAVAKLGRGSCDCLEPCNQKARRPFGTGLVDHSRIFAGGSDGPRGQLAVPGT